LRLYPKNYPHDSQNYFNGSQPHRLIAKSKGRDEGGNPRPDQEGAVDTSERPKTFSPLWLMMIPIPPSSSMAKLFAVDWLINDPAPMSDMIPLRIKKIPKNISNVFLFIAISFGVYCNANLK